MNTLNEANFEKIFMEKQTDLNHWTLSGRTVKPGTIFGRFQGATFTVITVEPRVKLNVPREESFKIPLR